MSSRLSKVKSLLLPALCTLMLLGCSDEDINTLADAATNSAESATDVQMISNITLTAGAARTVADGSSRVLLRASVKAQDGSPMAGQIVTFNVTAGDLDSETEGNQRSHSATTNTLGIAEVDLIAPTIVGRTNITATSGGIIAADSIYFYEGAVADIQIRAFIPTEGGECKIVVALEDAHRNPVTGETVRFVITENNLNSTFSQVSESGTQTSLENITNAFGELEVLYKSHQQSLESDTIVASVANGTSKSVNVNSACNQVISPSQTQSLKIERGATTLLADGRSRVVIHAQVTGKDNQPRVGVDVTLSTTLGNIVDIDGEQLNTPVTTDSRGIAEAYLISTIHLGIATLTASVDGVIANERVEFIAGPVTRISVTATPTTVTQGGVSQLTFKASDVNGLPVAGEALRVELTTNNSNAKLSAISATTNINGEAVISYTAGNGSGTDTIRATAASNSAVSGVVNLSVDVGSGGTGNPETALITVSRPHIFVKGVGKQETTGITVTIVDGAGNKIGESGYSSENIRLSFATSPMGGEVLGGNDLNGEPVTPAREIWVASSDGVASINLQSGTIAGVVAILVEVYDGTGQESENFRFSAMISEIVIASGPAHSINLTSPNINAIENLGGGVYRRIGKALVIDRYGNAVPDRTVVNLGLVDSVIAKGSDGSITLPRDLTSTPDNPLNFAGQAIARGNDFTTAFITRNNVARMIESNDRLLITNANAEDKSRVIAARPTAHNTITVQKDFINRDRDPSADPDPTLNYLIGAATLGGGIAGLIYDSEWGESLTQGVAHTRNGIATFYVTYPAHEQRILLGCGIGGSACDRAANFIFPQSQASCLVAGGNWINYHDQRYVETDRQEVYVVASVSESQVDSAVTMDRGQFCYTPIAGFQLDSSTDKLSASGWVTLQLWDGGDRIALPFYPISASATIDNRGSGCFIGNVLQADVAKNDCTMPGASWLTSNFGLDISEASCTTDNPGDFRAGDAVTGACTGYVEVTGERLVKGDRATVTWRAGDATTSVSVVIP
jgi:hypothetical protein